MHTSKTRALVKEALETDVGFVDKMRCYLSKTQGAPAFYENRLPFEDSETMWKYVDQSRQCRCCGQMLVSAISKVKLMSCGTCRVTYYCDRACQRRDWKQVHKSVCRDMGGKKCMEEVLHICVRALTLMALSTTGGAFAPFAFTATDPGGLNSIFSFEQHDAVLSAEDTFTV